MNISKLCALSGGAVTGIVFGVLALCFIVFFACFVPAKSYLIALMSGAYVSMFTLAGMKLRKIDTLKIVEPHIAAKKAGLKISIKDLESLLFAGGHCDKVVNALVAAKGASLSLTFEQAKAVDLAGHDINEVVESCICPTVITCNGILGCCDDEVELSVDCALTVKANISSVVGGYNLETLKVKVSEQIISQLSRLDSKSVMKKPKSLLSSLNEIEGGGAYDLVSAEITRVDFSRDIGMERRAKETEANRANAQMDADKLIHVAQLREIQARTITQEKKTEVLEAEAEVPRALADAIKEGRFSVMDYYKLMNLQADTAMRRALVNKDDEPRS